MEIWKDVEGYEGLYQVSNMGRVKSLGNELSNNSKEKILKSYKNGKSGYLLISLCKEGKIKKYLLHRLVAQAFLPNPNNLPEVNHKDENHQNNCVENLEYCNAKYNANYGSRNKKISKALKNRKDLSKPILQFTKDGEFIRRWDNAREVERELGIKNSNIPKCCKGKYKTVGGYKWCYAVINGFTIDINKLKKVA